MQTVAEKTKEKSNELCDVSVADMSSTLGPGKSISEPHGLSECNPIPVQITNPRKHKPSQIRTKNNLVKIPISKSASQICKHILPKIILLNAPSKFICQILSWLQKLG